MDKSIEYWQKSLLDLDNQIEYYENSLDEISEAKISTTKQTIQFLESLKVILKAWGELPTTDRITTAISFELYKLIFTNGENKNANKEEN